MRIYYLSNGEGVFVEATLEKEGVAIDEYHRTWLLFANERWQTGGVPKNHGGGSVGQRALNYET